MTLEKIASVTFDYIVPFSIKKFKFFDSPSAKLSK